MLCTLANVRDLGERGLRAGGRKLRGRGTRLAAKGSMVTAPPAGWEMTFRSYRKILGEKMCPMKEGDTLSYLMVLTCVLDHAMKHVSKLREQRQAHKTRVCLPMGPIKKSHQREQTSVPPGF
jgi:hypothetical protein